VPWGGVGRVLAIMERRWASWGWGGCAGVCVVCGWGGGRERMSATVVRTWGVEEREKELLM
jgi:hypothetical protein